jgi:hypothetical protein
MNVINREVNMTQVVTGALEGVAVRGQKENPDLPIAGKFGGFFNVGLKVNGNWYNKLMMGNSKDEAKAKLGLAAGTVVELTVDSEKKVQKDGIKVLTSGDRAAPPIAPARTTAAGPVASREDSFRDNAIGQQVGNALNVAAGIAAEGTSVPALRELAIQILNLSNELKEMVKTNSLPKTFPVKNNVVELKSKKETAQKAKVKDEEIDWES